MYQPLIITDEERQMLVEEHTCAYNIHAYIYYACTYAHTHAHTHTHTHPPTHTHAHTLLIGHGARTAIPGGNPAVGGGFPGVTEREREREREGDLLGNNVHDGGVQGAAR